MSAPLHVRLGFVPLTDCAPLVIALETGLFANEGLDVELLREASWASIRDRVAVGDLAGAHMLAPLALATRLGLGGIEADLLYAVALGRNGDGITVVERWADTIAGDPAFGAGAVVAAARSHRARPRFAVVHPFSMHHYLLRHWLRAGGVDPNRDVSVLVLPPALVGTALAGGQIDGFCVGEPWNSMAQRRGQGRFLLGSARLWGQHPEKVLGMHEDWCRRHPEAHLGLIRAVVAASRWIEEGEHWRTTADILASPHYLDCAPGDLIPFDPAVQTEATGFATTFHHHGANFPWQSQALWALTQMQQCGQLPAAIDPRAVARATARSDLYRQALAGLDEPVPTVDYRIEGAHADQHDVACEGGGTLTLAADAFLAEPPFDPDSLAASLPPEPGDPS